ncbi:Baculoviral IAP repeat-containing protein 6, partial [Chelonia mydas]
KPGGRVKCQYISAVDKVIFVDDYAVGCRKDLNGILLLDTALQTPVSKQDDVVQLELPVTEWATVTFHLPHHVLKSVANAIVNELKKINQNIAALPVASSVMDRLSYLLPSARPELGVGPGRSVDRSLMYSEANRRETFTSWPHVGYRWAQPDPMAQAGFYHQVHLKFEINAYDPAIVQQLVLSGEQSSGVDSRRPTLAWLEDSSSCSDIPKLEGDSDDLLEDSDSEEHSRSESVTGHTSQKETMEVSLDVTALSILQQPEKLQWEIVANVLEDTVKDLEELGANPCLANCKSEKMKEKHLEQHNIPFPCLLAGGLLTYKSPATSPVSSNSQRSLDGLSRTRGESVSEQGSTDNESCTNSELNSPLVRRTLPILLLYSIKESDEKAGKIFSQMNNIMSKSLHDDGFTVPQIIEMELDSQEQLLLQDPPVTYIQQFADAAANLTSPDSDKWNSMVPKPGTLVQCLRLPKFAEEENLCVDSITPCADGVHLLVGLRTCPVESLSAINQVEALNNLNKLNSALCNRRKSELESSLAVVNGTNISVIQHESPADVQTPLIIQPEQRNVSGGYLVLYKMNYATRIVTLEEEPIKIQHIKDPQDTITSLILLPPDILDNRDDECEEPVEEIHLTPKNGNGREKKSEISTLGHLVITTQGGFVKILDLSNFEILAKVEPPKKEGNEEPDMFVSVIYCSGTDRLCACTKGGELHFLQIGGTCDDVDEADILVDGSLSKGVEQSSEGMKPLSNPSSPGITAHSIEMERNGKPTLVELNEEMQNMDVEESQCLRLCPFLEDHKEDILCGPVWLATGLDLSGHAGMLTLTSPKLVKGMAGGKYRSFLIHVKAVNDRGTEEICNGGIRPVVRIPSLKPQSSKGNSLASLLAKVAAGKEKSSNKIEASNSSRKSDNLRGCDLLQEVSVTIRRFKKTSVSKERVQRCAMLQFSEFHEKLLNTLCKKTDDGLTTEHAQSLVLDTLCWLAGVQSNGPGSSKDGNESLLSKTRKCLSDIVRVCFFEAGRSIAHKCARFLALCISNGKCDPSQQGFGSVLLKALLGNISFLPAAATGGSVYWYFVLLNYVKDEDLAGCSTACASLLTAVSRQLQDRLTPMEALLQTRYGLYSSPFDPVLFDLEMSGSSCKNVYNSSIGVQSDEIDLSDVLSGNGKISGGTAAEGSFTSLTGLLEVEPLHFTCVSTSDGTRIERDDAMSTFGVTPAVGGLSSGTVGEASTALSSAAQVALQSLSHAMASAEQQLQVLQEKQQQLLKLQQQNPLGSGLALAISHASHFLQPPPHQSIIIERMHSGARRFVTLDFGRPVLLTDVLIPTCGDLASLSIDIWTLGEEVDGRRLVVATDISTHSLILHDLIPPPVCRFMKITVIGRYGSTNARAKIPLGFYYGHTYILPLESELKLMHDPLRGEGEAANQPEIDQHLTMMIALQEDIQCRYNLACHRLEILLQSIDLPPLNSANNAQYFLRKPDKAVEEDSRVFSAYQDCIQLQLQLNLAHHAVQRLKVALGASRKTLKEQPDPKELIQMSSTEQLRTIIRYLLDTLLSLLHSSNGHSVPVVLQSTFHAQACEELFKHLCISGTPKIRLHTGLLLVQLCGGERWWGQFLSNVLQELYNSEQLLIFPQDRVFVLLSCIGQRSLSNSGVLESLLNLLDNLLSPLQPHLPMHRRTEGVLDIPMISWVVMLVSRLLDYVATVEDEAATAKKPLNGKERERFLTGNQWSFINNSLHTQSLSRSSKGNSSLDRLYSRKIRKQLVHHKQQLNLLKAKQKALVEQMEKEKIQSNKGSSYKLLVEQAKLKQATSKHFKDLIRLRRTAEWPRSTLDTEVSTTKETPEIEPLPFTLAHERCISVVQKLALFLLSMDFTCHADLLLFVCKVLARIANATRPTIHLCEIVNETQLERLLLLLVGTDFNRGDISWGGAWAQYSLSCMLQDILAGELLATIAAEAMEEGAMGEDAGASAADSDDSLQQSTVQLVETIDEPLTHDIAGEHSGAPPLSSLEKDKDIDLELLQDLMEVDIDPLDIDLEKDPLAAKVFKPISSTWYDYWGADYGTYNYNPYIGGVGIPVAKPQVSTEKNGSQTLESLLQLWLTLSLNSSSSGSKDNGADVFLYNANRIPVISLNQAGSSSAIGAQESTAQLLVSDPNLIHVLVKFLSGTNPHGTNQHSQQVGPTATQAMQEFLTRLQVHLSSTCPQMFSEFLLKLIHILSTERGAFQTGQGPLDAQVKLLEFTLEQNFEVVSVSTISAVIESITFLVHHYITCSDKVMSRSGSDSSVGARACFGGLFANIIRPGDAKAVCGEMTRDQLMFDLLKLVNILVQLPLSSNREYSARVPVASSTTDSVSDEEKVSGGKDGNGNSSNIQGSTAYVADLVLANQQIMSQILSALGQCNSSAMAMIIGASGLHLTKHENFHGGLDAISVGDGLFTILTTLSKKATTVQVMLQPILTYMACGYMGRQGSLATCQLSEPLLWFILRVLDTSEALKAFHDMGGVQLICNNMVTSTRAIVNTARSMVSTIMKFLDSGPSKATDSSLKARVLASEPDNAEGIHNFAPLGSITSSSPTAQPAEVLLQATPPHRRARSAAWSYIFLPEEAWCDLTIHLPAAVLLKEIHIQPHLASLANLNSPLLFGRLNGLSSDSTIDILYQLGTTQDPGTKDRIQALLKWVSDSARAAAMKKNVRISYICPNSSTREYGLLMPSPSHLHCVAAILWHSYELLVEYDLPALLNRELFESLFNWSMSLPCNMVLKKAVDSLLCSMCHIHPNYFSLLMGWMDITPPPMQCQHRLSMTDDSKKQDLSSSLTDDSKNAQAPLALTESHLATLAASSQSPEAIKQLLDSGLPSLLVRSLASFCFNHTSSSDCTSQSVDITQDRLRRHHVPQHFNKMPITADLVAPVLRFLTEVGNSHIMKDWLGGSEVNPLWTALLFLLCHSGATSGGHSVVTQQTSARSTLLSSTAGTGLTTQQRTAIENATVAFFLQCISCHPNNQRLMAQLYKGRINATSHVIQHPMYGAGHKFRTLHLPVSTTLAEVLDRVSGKFQYYTPSITAKLINEQKEDKEKKNYEEKEKVKAENGFQDNYSVVVASGLKSQSKRAVSSTPPRPPSRRGRMMADKVGSSSSGGESSSKTISVPVFHLYHKLLPGQPLPAEMTLAQLLTLLYDRKLPQGYRSIDLTVKLGSKVISDPSLSKTDSFKRLHTEKEHADLLGSCPEEEAVTPGEECMDAVLDESFLETCPIQSPLQVFAGMGGLALIAERLPMLYPDVIQQVSAPVVTSTTQEKQKDSDQFEWVTIEQSGELVYEAPETIAAEPPPIKSAVQTMSPIPAHSLAAFGLFLRLPGYAEPQVSSTHNSASTEEQQLYWAKGTGFGTGSTASGWDVEQALTKQRLEEEHVTCLLQVLASYINPAGSISNGETQTSHEGRGQNSNALPSVLLELLSQSCLIPAMSSYLRNDSEREGRGTGADTGSPSSTSPDLSEVGADDGLEGITVQPSTPGTFEAAKDLIELLAAGPLPYGENPLAPMLWVPSRAKLATVCNSRTPSWHRSRSWSWSSSDSADSHLPAAQKEVATPAVGRCEEALERARRSPAPPRDQHWEELRRPSPEDSRRWSRSRERWHRSLALPWPSRSASPQSSADSYSSRYSYLHQALDSRDPQIRRLEQLRRGGHEALGVAPRVRPAARGPEYTPGPPLRRVWALLGPDRHEAAQPQRLASWA